MSSAVPKPCEAPVLDALDSAIQHWERLQKCRTTRDVAIEGLEPASKLCAMFLDQVDPTDEVEDGCYGCPVRNVTGQSACVGSPYATIARYHRDAMEAELGRGGNTDWLVFRERNWFDLCQAEIDFLTQLRESTEG